MTTDDIPIHLFNYDWYGQKWSFQIAANSKEDAEEILAALPFRARYDGPLFASIPGDIPAAGFMARFIVWWKNLWTHG